MSREGILGTIAAIQNAKVLVDNGWCKNSFAKDSNGNSVHYLSNRAIKFDMSGALFRCSEELSPSQRDMIVATTQFVLTKKINPESIEFNTIIEFNDSCENKYGVLNMLDNMLEILNQQLKEAV